ncbi:Hypothetical predicted protein [Mytilus galloprovincialis]|uniref:SOCS box domain-containing protein n=1 Tax=Mytilus galloprovincialis TaxID=29158 RepID=A0A8B6EMX9_MYTGA|nr:Hypothetical predicted protein [Mytilus galloprovincialis]
MFVDRKQLLPVNMGQRWSSFEGVTCSKDTALKKAWQISDSSNVDVTIIMKIQTETKQFGEVVDRWTRHTELTALTIACLNNDVKLVKKLIKKGADVNLVARGDQHENYKNSVPPIFYAANNRNADIVKLLINAGTWRGKVYEANRPTTLHISSPWFICTAAIVLLQHGVDPNLYSFGDILRQCGEHCMFSRQEDYCIDDKIFLATFVSSGYDLTVSDMNCYENDYFQIETDYHLLKGFGRPPSLKHLARTQIRKHIRFVNMDTSVFPIIDKLKLPTILKDFLKLFDVSPADISAIVCYEHRR